MATIICTKNILMTRINKSKQQKTKEKFNPICLNFMKAYINKWQANNSCGEKTNRLTIFIYHICF